MEISDWLGKAVFEKIKSEPGPHLFVFAAKWCRFCKRFIEQTKALQEPANVEIKLVNTDDPDKSLWDDFSIKIVPTIIVFKDGKSIFRIDGRRAIFHPVRAGLNMTDLEQALSSAS